MRVLRNASELDAYLGNSAWRRAKGPVIVPTMGALHDGHGHLIQQGVACAQAEGSPGGCVVWIFVNPTQFTDPSDLRRYPRTLEADLDLCARCRAAAVFAPTLVDVYPPGVTIEVPPLPDVATSPRLEDAHRPGHFAGVCQVVNRFFSMMRPSVAMFGEKDWQQLAVIRAMVAQRGIDTRIQPVPTVREPDGLAMSSRNRFLDADARARAASLFRALQASNNARTAGAAEDVMRRILLEAGLDVDYAVIRDAATLRPVPADEPRRSAAPRRALIAARVGGVRLIDNADWSGEPGGG